MQNLLELSVSTSIALQEKDRLLYLEGHKAIGYLVAAVMALALEDIFATIEGEVVSERARRSVCF